MALETGLSDSQPNENRRQFHSFKNGTAVLTSQAMNGFVVGNMVGMAFMVKATSVAGTPKYTLSLQTSFEDVDATYTDVSAISRPDFISINDENYHVYTVNFANCMQYARFYITLEATDGGDDLFYFKACGLYGSFTHASDVSLELPSVTLGSVKIEDGTTAATKAMVKDAATAGTALGVDHVIVVQQEDQAGKILNLGTAAMAASAPMTLATDDTQFGAVGAAALVTGGVHAQLRYVGEAVDNIPVQGAALMAASLPVTLATDDTHFGAVGAAALVTGGVHAQLRYIGEAVDNIPALGAALMAASTPVTLATDDTHFGSVGAASDVDGVIHGQLRYIGEAVDNLPVLGSAAMAASIPVTIATDDTQFGAVGAAADADGNFHAQLKYMNDALDAMGGGGQYKAVATGAGAIALTSAAADVWELNSVTVHFDIAPTTSENLEIKLDSIDGAAYDTVFLKVDPSAAALTDITFIPNTPLELASGDEVVVTFTNTNARTYGVRIVGRKK